MMHEISYTPNDTGKRYRTIHDVFNHGSFIFEGRLLEEWKNWAVLWTCMFAWLGSSEILIVYSKEKQAGIEDLSV